MANPCVAAPIAGNLGDVLKKIRPWRITSAMESALACVFLQITRMNSGSSFFEEARNSGILIGPKFSPPPDDDSLHSHVAARGKRPRGSEHINNQQAKEEGNRLTGTTGGLIVLRTHLRNCRGTKEQKPPICTPHYDPRCDEGWLVGIQ